MRCINDPVDKRKLQANALLYERSCGCDAPLTDPVITDKHYRRGVLVSFLFKPPRCSACGRVVREKTL